MLLATVMCTAMLTGCGSDSAANESSQASGSSVAETAAAGYGSTGREYGV